MLAYLANRPVPGQRQSSPNALLLVISVHVALLAVVMSAKMDLPAGIKPPPIPIFWVPKPTDPPTPTTQTQRHTQQTNNQIDRPRTEVITPPLPMIRGRQVRRRIAEQFWAAAGRRPFLISDPRS